MEQNNSIRISEAKLVEIIKNTIKKNLKQISDFEIQEGIKYNLSLDTFTFDFNNDNSTDIIQLQKVGYQITAFNHCYYYGYEFEKNIDKKLRTDFIKSLKFPNGKISEKDKEKFIKNAVNKLDNDISLPLYKIVVYPESMSELNREMLQYLDMFAYPNLIKMELIKSLPSKIEFDYKRFKIEVLDSILPNGRNRYTESQKNEAIKNIQAMMDDIHNLQYFSIARDVKKTKYRKYIKNYYSFKNESDKQLFEFLLKTNVLIIDDIVTSGATMSQLINSLRTVNDSNNIVIFSLMAVIPLGMGSIFMPRVIYSLF